MIEYTSVQRHMKSNTSRSTYKNLRETVNTYSKEKREYSIPLGKTSRRDVPTGTAETTKFGKALVSSVCEFEGNDAM